jgi:hypothetical protein
MKGKEPGMAFDHLKNARETKVMECMSNQGAIMQPAE